MLSNEEYEKSAYIANLKSQLQKYKYDVEQVELFDIQRDDYDNVLSNNSRSIFIKRFTELMLVWVEECKKNKKKVKK